MGNIVNVCVYIHQSVERKSKQFYEELRRFNYVTPTSYLELLMCFIKLLIEKRNDLEGLKGRLTVGLDKLLTTADEVALLQEELVLLQPVLIISTKEAEEMMATIAIDQADAAVTKEQVCINMNLIYPKALYIFLRLGFIDKSCKMQTLFINDNNTKNSNNIIFFFQNTVFEMINL